MAAALILTITPILNMPTITAAIAVNTLIHGIVS